MLESRVCEKAQSMGSRSQQWDPTGLDPTTLPLLAEAARIAAHQSADLWLVGGAVRDVELGRPCRDLDVVVDGDGLAVALELARLTGRPCRQHEVFLTAELDLPDGSTLNIATARRERYSRPAALPAVEPASIEEDLGRRDFSINSMAVEVLTNGFGRLLDPWQGRRDLGRRSLRVLHAASFEDDPTRAFRGLRFESRLGFSFHEESTLALTRALGSGAFNALSGARLRSELERTFAQIGSPGQLLSRAAQLGLLAVIDPDLQWSDTARERFEVLEDPRVDTFAAGRDPALLGLMTLLFELDGPGRARAIHRLGLVGRTAEEAETGMSLVNATAEALPRMESASEAARLLLALSSEAKALLWAVSPGSRSWLLWSGRELEARRRQVQGRDLVAAGVAPGPRVGEALGAVQEALWEARIDTSEELAYALNWLTSKESQ